MAGDGFVYIASERDNADKGVNRNVVLKVDPAAPGPDVVATREWDLTSSLPAVSANTEPGPWTRSEYLGLSAASQDGG